MSGKNGRNLNNKSIKGKRKLNDTLSESSGKSPLTKRPKSSNCSEIVNEISSDSDASTASTLPLRENLEQDLYLSSTDDESQEDNIKSEKIYESGSDKIKKTSRSTNETDTFCVDMGRFKSFNYSTANSKQIYHGGYLSPEFSPKSHEIPNTLLDIKGKSKSNNQSTSFSMVNKRNMNSAPRNHIYRPHEHRKGVPVTTVPCKGPACRVQICCAQFCSQKCFKNQISPLGTESSYKLSLYDYDGSNSFQMETVTDYGLRYPDHTYCQDHKNVYFVNDLGVDEPPYVQLVESLYYLEKEARITNPRPPPDSHGDPISATGYANRPAHTAKRGRPRRSHLVGMLDPYVFHPSTELEYRPFIFREPIIEAERLSMAQATQEPIVYAIRNCSNLYKDTRPDIPRHVLYEASSSTCVPNQVSNTNTQDTLPLDNTGALVPESNMDSFYYAQYQRNHTLNTENDIIDQIWQMKPSSLSSTPTKHELLSPDCNNIESNNFNYFSTQFNSRH